jgi:soluble lytic murein transglycosylase-like protein
LNKILNKAGINMLGPIITLLVQVVIASTDNSSIIKNNQVPLIKNQEFPTRNIGPDIKKHGPTSPRELAQSASNRFCDNPQLAMAIMKVESNFINRRAPTEDSTGLMQVRPSTAQWIGCLAQSEQDLLNIELNIRCGCRYLGRLGHLYSNIKDVIASYNAGAPRICRRGILQPSGKPCTIGHYINQDYVDKVWNEYANN